MKSTLLTATLILLPVSLVDAAPSPAAVVWEDEQAAFRKAFETAMTIGAKAEMKQLVAKQTDQACYWIIETAELLGTAPNDALAERMTALSEAWRSSIGTDFPTKMETFFSLMKPTIKRDRTNWRKEYDKQVTAYFKNLEEKDDPTFAQVGARLELLAKQFTSIGDYFYASQCWSFVGHCFDETLRGKQADLDKAAEAFISCIETRDKIGLKDRLYLSTKPRIEQLVGLGFGPGAAGAAGAKTGPEPTGAVINAAMTFELVEEIDPGVRPSYYLDELYSMWATITLYEKDGDPVAVPRVKDAPQVQRVGAAKAMVDEDLDGEGDVEVPLRGRLEPIVFEIGEGEARRKMAILGVTGVQKDIYNGVELNLEPTQGMVNLYFAAGGSMVGEIAGTRIQVIDDDLDGVYGSVPQAWGQVGLTKDHYQPEIDTIWIEGEKRARPWSEYQQIDGQWYRLEIEHGGKSIKATPLDLPTGILKLKTKGPKPDHVIVKGTNDYENTLFDLVGAKEVEVPIGRWQLYFGIVSKGKKRQRMKALMIAGEDTPHWDIMNPGDEGVVEVGAPYGFDFEIELKEDSIRVIGQSVCITGKSDERDERFWGAVPRPSVSYRAAGSKRGSKPKTMPAVLAPEPVYEDWAAAWFPLDLEIPKRAKEDVVELQLTEKKNKLFGKITSVWK